VNKLIFLKNREVKAKDDLSECTFTPRTNSTKKIDSKNCTTREKEKLYNRTLKWKKKKEEQIDKEKILAKKDDDDCTFKPNLLNMKNINTIFDMKSSVMNDFSARNYMLRLQAARKQEKEKKSRLVTTTKNFERMRMRRYVRSVSADKAGFSTTGKRTMQSSIRNLHDELHTLTLER